MRCWCACLAGLPSLLGVLVHLYLDCSAYGSVVSCGFALLCIGCYWLQWSSLLAVVVAGLPFPGSSSEAFDTSAESSLSTRAWGPYDTQQCSQPIHEHSPEIDSETGSVATSFCRFVWNVTLSGSLEGVKSEFRIEPFHLGTRKVAEVVPHLGLPVRGPHVL